MKTLKNKRQRAVSKIISVRYHEDELSALDKKRKKAGRSVYIRAKSLS